MTKQTNMFGAGEDLPLFSGTPQPGKDSTFTPKDEPHQLTLTDCKWCLGAGWIEYQMMYGDRVISENRTRCFRCNPED
jgi:hypothetical protein